MAVIGPERIYLAARSIARDPRHPAPV